MLSDGQKRSKDIAALAVELGCAQILVLHEHRKSGGTLRDSEGSSWLIQPPRRGGRYSPGTPPGTLVQKLPVVVLSCSNFDDLQSQLGGFSLEMDDLLFAVLGLSTLSTSAPARNIHGDLSVSRRGTCELLISISSVDLEVSRSA